MIIIFIKELAEKCLGKKKYINLTVSIEKEVTRIDKDGEEITKNIYYIF